MKDRLIILALTLLILPSLALAQYRDDFLRPFFGYYDSQSLTTAIGNATVAAGQVIPGRSSNPANLGLNRFGHLQVSFQNNSFQSASGSSTLATAGGVYSALPVRVYQGSLVFGCGVQRVMDFSNAFKTATAQSSEEGGLYATELGFSVEAAEDLFVGAAFNYLRGSNELSVAAPDTNALLNPNYRGYNFTVGFLNRSASNLHIGASVEFPTVMGVEEKLTTWAVISPGESISKTWNYTLTRPMVFHLGFSFLYPMYSFFYELEWTDWQGLDFSSGDFYAGDVAVINREIKEEMRATLSHHLGAAGHLPWLPLHLYAGYQYLPVPFEGDYSGDRRQSVSLGGSYLLNQQFSLHSSHSHYFWKYDGHAESYDMLVFGTSFHF